MGGKRAKRINMVTRKWDKSDFGQGVKGAKMSKGH